ncbi:MAG TPA: amidohydrolase family protein [Gemmatimonadota bacterium]|nr:amidohydrolase family protein [Gemmatimonadota bacterium]
MILPHARSLLVLAAAGLSFGAIPGLAQDPRPLAFIDVHVVTMESDTLLPNRTVLVVDGRIAAVVPADSAAIPRDAIRVETSGAFLMPGLIDLHVHPTDEHDFPLYLANGVTSVQFLNAFPAVLEWRDRVVSGRLASPTIHACGGPVSGIADPAEARRRVAVLDTLGFGCIKIYDEITKEAYAALVAAARELGLLSVGHIPRDLTWGDMLEVAPDAVAHAEEFLYSPIESEADLGRIVQGMSADGIAVITTLWNYDLIGRQPVMLDELRERPELRFYSPVDRRGWEPGQNRYLDTPIEGVPNRRRLLRFQRTLVKRLHEGGATVLLGTDAGNNFVLPGWSAHAELAQLVQSGLTPYEALVAGTRNAARFLGAGEETGMITVGRRADLVLLAGNPLQDISNAGLILGVAVRGRWLPRDRLREGLEEQAAAFVREEAFLRDFETRGVEAALHELERSTTAGDPVLRPRALNELGYQLWYWEENLDHAIRVFEANTRLHPEWWAAHGSLAEAYAAAGRTDRAIAEYRRALELNPADREIARALGDLSREGGT